MVHRDDSDRPYAYPVPPERGPWLGQIHLAVTVVLGAALLGALALLFYVASRPLSPEAGRLIETLSAEQRLTLRATRDAFDREAAARQEVERIAREALAAARDGTTRAVRAAEDASAEIARLRAASTEALQQEAAARQQTERLARDAIAAAQDGARRAVRAAEETSTELAGLKQRMASLEGAAVTVRGPLARTLSSSQPAIVAGPTAGGSLGGRGEVSAERAAVPAAAADPRDPRVVDMLFATSRKADLSGPRITFTRERADDLLYGSVRVRVPEHHKVGRIELPRIYNFYLFKYEQATDPTKHFFIRDLALLTRDNFVNTVRSADRADVLVFVHGFNNSFEQATFRLAQMVYDMDYRGLPVVFSWPAASGLHGYRHDIDSARLSRDRFVGLLQLLQQDAGVKTVHIIAHSMGNALVLEALDRVAGERLPLAVGEVVMAAPDVDRGLFKQLMDRVNKVAKGMTLYASSADAALAASKALALDIARAGDVPPPPEGPLVLPYMDTIDVSAFGQEFLGLHHDTFASNRSLIDDIGRLIKMGQRPPAMRTPQIRGHPEGVNPPSYWLYPL